MAKDRRTKDQKRKAKLAKRSHRPSRRESLALTGDEFKTKKLVHVHHEAELAIYETYVASNRSLTDQDVEQALIGMVERMRDGTLQPPSEEEDGHVLDLSDPEEYIITNIQQHWDVLFRSIPNPGKDKRIGVLRTILGSIETWKSPGPKSKGYLRYLGGFLKKLGYNFVVCDEDFEAIAEPVEPRLLVLGRAWARFDGASRTEFEELAAAMIAAGDPAAVVDVCQQLLGENPNFSAFNPECEASLMAWSLRARQSQLTALG